jgi:hypothetical protein
MEKKNLLKTHNLKEACQEYLACLYIRGLSFSMRRVHWHSEIARWCYCEPFDKDLCEILHNLDKLGYDVTKENTDGKTIKEEIDRIVPEMVVALMKLRKMKWK